jgi:hypothetical protein
MEIKIAKLLKLCHKQNKVEKDIKNKKVSKKVPKKCKKVEIFLAGDQKN